MRAWSQGGIQFAGQPAGEEAPASLQRHGASYGGPALVTVGCFADRTNGHLRVTRADWLHQVDGADSGEAASWSRSELAASGVRRKLDELDLKPGLPARPGEELVKLTDVPWPARSAAP